MLEDFLGSSQAALYKPSGSKTKRDEDSADKMEASVETLLHQKSHVLHVKLEILAMEMVERFRLRSQNIERISEGHDQASLLLEKLSRQADYHLREHRDKKVFYDALFALDKEKRQEEVECWRDVVQVMRDFLYVWEAHELAKARAIFLTHAGS